MKLYRAPTKDEIGDISLRWMSGPFVEATLDYEAAADAFIERLKELSAGTGEMVALGVEMSMILAAVDAAVKGDDDGESEQHDSGKLTDAVYERMSDTGKLKEMSDTTAVREELIQVAAVAIAIVQDIDTGSAKVGLGDLDGDLDEVMYQVKWERKQQNAKWGAQHHTIPEWLMILGEEYGEACQAAVDAHWLDGARCGEGRRR